MEPYISDWRRASCGDLTSAFDFKSPKLDRTSLALPDTADQVQSFARSLASSSLRIWAEQAPSRQDAGARQGLLRPMT